MRYRFFVSKLFVLVLACFVAANAMKVQEEYSAKQYGNKTHNLSLLNSKIAQEFKIGDFAYTVKVPDFVGYTSDEIKKFLSKNGLDIDKEWSEICAPLLLKEKTILDTIFDTKQYPPEFLSRVEELSSRIRVCFQQHIFEPLTHLADDPRFKNNRLMVRSTGKEDTKEFANAGGNETVANVEPTAQAVSQAMGVVVASYIGIKSLKQRLAVAPTKAHIAEILGESFLPVLVQTMIGEKLDGEEIKSKADIDRLPVSGVMFTTEAEGNTPGVTQLQTAFGHNEAVVNSLVPVDTWYIARDGTYYPIIRKKTHRYYPLSAGGLDKKANEPILVDRPTLPAPTIGALNILADRIQVAYNNTPMDVELVVMKNTIYLVQARPIVFGDKKPAYVPDTFVAKCEKIQCVKFGIGDGALREARGRMGLLIDDKLDRALMTYLSMPKAEREAVKCVIIKEMAASTSHAATTFRAENMPVLQLDTDAELVKWLEDPDVRLVVDIQRGLVLRPGKVIDDKTPIPVTQGWFECPLPRQLSVRPQDPDNVGMPKELKIVMSMFNVAATREEWGRKKIPELFEIIKQSTSIEATQVRMSLVRILDWLRHRLWLPGTLVQFGQIEKLPDEISREVKEISLEIFKQALVCAREILHTLPGVERPRDLRMLYHVNFLQALVWQQDDLRIVDQYSLAHLRVTVQQNIRALSILEETKEPAASEKIHALKLSEKALMPATAQRWNDFIMNYFTSAQQLTEQEKKAVQGLSRMLIDLGNIGLLPLWLNVVFDGVAKEYPELPDEAAFWLIKNYQEAKDFLHTLVDYKRQLDGLDINQFASPDAFKVSWPAFAHIIDLFSSDVFLSVFKNVGAPKNNIAQLAALNVMTDFVIAFDTAIKTVTGQQDYPLEKKVANFKTMVTAYWGLFKKWSTVVPPGTFKAAADSRMSETRDAGSPLIVDRYLAYFDQKFSEKTFTGVETLRATDAFNVSAALINSSALIERSDPRTLEDFFTLTHQNLLATISTLMNLAVAMEKIELPPLVQLVQQRVFKDGFIIQLRNLFGNVTQETYKPQLQSFSFDHDILVLSYNLPLRHHSARLELAYDAKKPRAVELRAYYFGAVAPERWNSIYSYAGLIDALCNTSLIAREKDVLHATVSYAVSNKTDLGSLKESMTWMTAAAFGLFTTPIPDNDLIKLIEKLELYQVGDREHAIDLASDMLLALWRRVDQNKVKNLVDAAAWLFTRPDELIRPKQFDRTTRLILALLTRPLQPRMPRDDAPVQEMQTSARSFLTSALIPELLKNFARYEKSGLIETACFSDLPEVNPVKIAWRQYIIKNVDRTSLESLMLAMDILYRFDRRNGAEHLTPEFLKIAASFMELADEKLRASDPLIMYQRFLVPLAGHNVGNPTVTLWFIDHCHKFVDANMVFPEGRDPLQVLRSWWGMDMIQQVNEPVHTAIWKLAEHMRLTGSRYWPAVWHFWLEEAFALTYEEYGYKKKFEFIKSITQFTDQVKDFLKTHEWFDNYFTPDLLENILRDCLGSDWDTKLGPRLSDTEKVSFLSIFDELFPFLEKSLEKNMREDQLLWAQRSFDLFFNTIWLRSLSNDRSLWEQRTPLLDAVGDKLFPQAVVSLGNVLGRVKEVVEQRREDPLSPTGNAMLELVSFTCDLFFKEFENQKDEVRLALVPALYTALEVYTALCAYLNKYQHTFDDGVIDSTLKIITSALKNFEKSSWFGGNLDEQKRLACQGDLKLRKKPFDEEMGRFFGKLKECSYSHKVFTAITKADLFHLYFADVMTSARTSFRAWAKKGLDAGLDEKQIKELQDEMSSW
jgi:hypothetical protein